MEKQTYYVTQQIVKHNKMYGYNTVDARVYKLLDDGRPSLIHAFTYQTGAVPGIQNLVLRELASNGKIHAQYAKDDYYAQDNIKIFEM